MVGRHPPKAVNQSKRAINAMGMPLTLSSSMIFIELHIQMCPPCVQRYPEFGFDVSHKSSRL